MFYVYIYLDPRKSGTYVYGEQKFNFEPIYVGKGSIRRSKVHINKAKSKNPYDNNLLKLNKIRKILKTGKEPIVEIVKGFSLEKDALDYEVNLIKRIGRIDLETGTLTNLTDGGEKSNLSLSTIRKMQAAKLGTHLSEETKKKMSEGRKGKKNSFYGRTHTEETKKAISESRTGVCAGKNHPLYGKKMSKESRQKMSNAKKNIKGKDHPRSRIYKITNPDGKNFVFAGDFYGNCLKIGFKSPIYLREVAQGKRSDWNGWKCVYLK